MTTAAILEAKRADIIGEMRRLTPTQHGTTEADIMQFLVGFFELMHAAAQGDTSLRDDYLNGVIPAVKRSMHMSLKEVLGTLVVVQMAVAATVGKDGLDWTVGFCADYTIRLIDAWERA